MRIAFCISGHLRTYRSPVVHQKFQEFKNYISSFGEIDTFVACWNRQNTGRSWSAAHKLHDSSTINNFVSSEDVLNHYNANNINILDYIFFDSEYSPLNYTYFTKNTYSWDERGINNNIIHSSKMFYLIYEANKLKMQHEYKNKFIYDYVFRIRPDHVFDLAECKNINLNNSLKDTLYIPSYNDRFAYGSSDIMNKYSHSIFHISSIFNTNMFGDPETLQRHCIENVISQNKIVYTPMFGVLMSDTGLFR